MKEVQLVRQRLARGLDHSLKQFLTWFSCTDGNLEEVDSLRIALTRSNTKPEPELIAKLTEVVLEHLGHRTQVNGKGNGNPSKAYRTAAKL
jgi:hypothetical protein